MKNRILLLLRYIHHFNIFRGVKLFIQVSILKVENINLKNYGTFRLRKNSSDVDIFNQIFIDKEYEFLIPYEPEIIIDAGANIGLTSIYFTVKYRIATIISIEPDSENFKILQENTAKYPNITPVKMALWNKDGHIFVLRSNSVDSHTVSEKMKENSEAIESITLSSIFDKFCIASVDILKMDVEGAEKEIFSGDFQKWLPKVKTLVIELHDRFKPGCSMSLFNALNGYNYSVNIKGELLIIYFN